MHEYISVSRDVSLPALGLKYTSVVCFEIAINHKMTENTHTILNYQKCYKLSAFWLLLMGNQTRIVSPKSTDVYTVNLYSFFTNEEII